jgi:hypothetical protein
VRGLTPQKLAKGTKPKVAQSASKCRNIFSKFSL